MPVYTVYLYEQMRCGHIFIVRAMIPWNAVLSFVV